MEYGVHLPQIGWDESSWSVHELREYVDTAERLGYRYLCAIDHLLFSRPWLDGLTTLAAVHSHTELTLATTISLPVVRGPVALAKMLGTIDLLSDGRLVVGVGAGSSEKDYEAVGIPFEERWPRFHEAVQQLRALWEHDQSFDGEFYSTKGIVLEPGPARVGGPPIWIGSWGSKPGLRRAARLGDGWLASGYNTTPERFADGKILLDTELRKAGRTPREFPNAIATMFFYVTEQETEANSLLANRLAPVLGRPTDELAHRLPIGSAETCADLLADYQAAGVERVFVWPIRDEREQIRRFHERVLPLVEAQEGCSDDVSV